MKPALQVLEPGPLALVQDLGRPGREQWGVAPSGAFDRASHALAQRLVGNPPDAAGLEVLLGGLRLVAAADVVVAVAGAPGEVTAGGRPETIGLAVRLRPGDEFALGRPIEGVRAYLAVRGGLAVPVALGSRSRDTGAGLGPAPLAAGDLLPAAPGAPEDAWFGPVPSPAPPLDRPAVVELAPGPHDDLVGDPGGSWTVAADSDRVGVRLVGGPSLRGVPGGLRSFPVVPGSVQVTPAGELLVLGPDAGVTGGYPVVGVVTASSLDRLAQCRPGDTVVVRRRTRRSPGRRTGAPSSR
jgi:biotin-dependent carboxylase-like uncharacterized protein